MDEQIETKWQYVARICRERGDTHNAKIADKIEEVLSTIHEYNRVTKEWEDDYKTGVVADTDIIDVVQCIDYCTACEYHMAGSCDDCIFAARGGRALYFTLNFSED